MFDKSILLRNALLFALISFFASSTIGFSQARNYDHDEETLVSKYKGIELWVGNGPHNDGIYCLYSETDRNAIVTYYQNGKREHMRIYGGSYSGFVSGDVIELADVHLE
jgi:hypothetical protein